MPSNRSSRPPPPLPPACCIAMILLQFLPQFFPCLTFDLMVVWSALDSRQRPLEVISPPGLRNVRLGLRRIRRLRIPLRRYIGTPIVPLFPVLRAPLVLVLQLRLFVGRQPLDQRLLLACLVLLPFLLPLLESAGQAGELC